MYTPTGKVASKRLSLSPQADADFFDNVGLIPEFKLGARTDRINYPEPLGWLNCSALNDRKRIRGRPSEYPHAKLAARLIVSASTIVLKKKATIACSVAKRRSDWELIVISDVCDAAPKDVAK